MPARLRAGGSIWTRALSTCMPRPLTTLSSLANHYSRSASSTLTIPIAPVAPEKLSMSQRTRYASSSTGRSSTSVAHMKSTPYHGTAARAAPPAVAYVVSSIIFLTFLFLSSIALHMATMAPMFYDPACTERSFQSTDFDTSNNLETRKYLKTYGLIPPAVDTYELQTQRCLALLRSRTTTIEQYQYLSVLRNTNVHLFYRLLAEHIKEITPLIYTPTVGEACQRWSELYTQPEGMYLSFEDRGNLRHVIANWQHDVDITVVTDGSRILGLGDLGINGMGIPVGKLSLYIACAGIHPLKTLPITLDLGTNNEELRKDPLYLGSRRPKVSPDEEREFLDEMMAALTERWPGIVIQYEDFKNPFPALERYQNTYAMFNDDIQGTGAVILGGFINAVKQSGVAAKDQRAVFLGAGSAGVGVAKQLTEFFMKEGLTEDEARRRFWLVDSQGLVAHDRPGRLAEHKVYFARDDNNGHQYRTLAEVVEYVKPTILMGLSTIGGAFTPEILGRMAELNERPVIFPLSNPSSKSECTFEEAVRYTDGKCLFASGSPFPALQYDDRNFVPGQGNNMYVFPGIGLGTILSKAVSVTQNMIYASGEALSTSLTPAELAENWLYPDVQRIREVSVVVTRGVIRAAQRDNVDRHLPLRDLSDSELDDYIRGRMYDPRQPNDIAAELQDLAQLVNTHQTAAADRPMTANGGSKL